MKKIDSRKRLIYFRGMDLTGSLTDLPDKKEINKFSLRPFNSYMVTPNNV